MQRLIHGHQLLWNKTFFILYIRVADQCKCRFGGTFMFILSGHLNHNKGLFQIMHNCYAIVDLLPIVEVFKKHIKMKKPRVIILFPKSRQSFFACGYVYIIHCQNIAILCKK